MTFELFYEQVQGAELLKPVDVKAAKSLIKKEIKTEPGVKKEIKEEIEEQDAKPKKTRKKEIKTEPGVEIKEEIEEQDAKPKKSRRTRKSKKSYSSTDSGVATASSPPTSSPVSPIVVNVCLSND
jgi:hypothetical protein